MKKFERMLLNGTGYTVLILTIYFLVAGFASGFSGYSVSFGRFLLILLFGFIIAGAGFIYEFLTVQRWLRVLLHYAILLATFCIIFIPGLNISNNGPATIIAWILIFTASYFTVSFIIFLIKKAVKRVDDAIDASASKPAETKKEGYTPLYTDRGEGK